MNQAYDIPSKWCDSFLSGVNVCTWYQAISIQISLRIGYHEIGLGNLTRKVAHDFPRAPYVGDESAFRSGLDNTPVPKNPLLSLPPSAPYRDRNRTSSTRRPQTSSINANIFRKGASNSNIPDERGTRALTRTTAGHVQFPQI